MICKRCGYCCIGMMVVIVKPECVEKPDFSSPDTFMVKMDPEECPYLSFDEDNKASCAIHDKPWFKKTPCHTHGQIEASPDYDCRMGAYMLKEGYNVRERAKIYRKRMEEAKNGINEEIQGRIKNGSGRFG